MSHKIFRPIIVLMLVIGLVVVVQTPQSARAAGPWYVTTTGDDNNFCLSSSSPCATIEGVLDKIGFSSGDTVLIGEGIYLGNLSGPLIIDQDTNFTGGWDPTFTSQSGYSTLDGQNLQALFAVASGVTSSVDHLIFQNTSTYGGHISAITNLGTLTVSNSIVQNNSANSGGGIDNSGNLTLNNVIVNNNATQSQTGVGGGIYNSGTLILNHSTVSDNISLPGYSSHGIGNINGSVILNNSTVSGNTGGISNRNGSVTLNNSTVSNNTVVNGGGNIINVTGTLALNNSTVTANSSTSGTGGIFNNGGDITLKNSILAGNTSTVESPDWVCFGTINISSEYSIVGDTIGCAFTPTTGDLTDMNALLAPLENNGGFTLTHALLPVSPAIDAGNPAGCTDQDGNLLTIDQRGVARPQGAACDIGAFEYEIEMVEVTIDIKPGSETNPINTKSRGTIPIAILSMIDFDAPAMVDSTSLTFGVTGDEDSLAFCNNEDVNEDGLTDVVCHFYTQSTGFQTGDTEGILKGQTVDGIPIEGHDTVNILK